ncbi:hypothetical protein HORIV_03210 [Vreelandella olivaria]|uniref:histidine kinase n=1 Tax=Vreelandella olivaria TaxID=390919 RepID=A0ABM7GBZ4_9GAMM|nr:hypothetical protein HORIV_03210 [Halomonas olivaria]
MERDLDDPALREYTHIIVEEVDRLRDLVDSMLGPNRILKHEPVNIHKVLERVRALLIAEHPCVTISRDYDPSLPDLSGDESQMIQAVLNVARNAVQAMSDAQTPEPSLILRTRARRQFTLGLNATGWSAKSPWSITAQVFLLPYRKRCFTPWCRGARRAVVLGSLLPSRFCTSIKG